MRNPLTICEVNLQFAESAYICGFRIQILRIPLIFVDSTYILRNPLIQSRNPEQLAIFACCGIRNKTNVPTKFTLQVYVCGIH